MNHFKRKFLHGSAGALVASIAVGASAYFIRRQMALGLSADDYAFFYSMYALLLSLLAIFRFGTPEVVLYQLPALLQKRKLTNARMLFSFVCHYQIVVFGGLTLLLVLCIPLFQQFYFSMPTKAWLILALLPFLLLTALETVQQNALNSLQEFTIQNGLKVLKSLLLLGGVLIFLYNGGLSGIIATYITSTLLIVVAGYWLIKRSGKLQYQFFIAPTIRKQALNAGAVFYALALGQAILNDFGTVVLTITSTTTEVVLYNIALPIATIIRSLYCIPMVFTPLSFELFNSGDHNQLRRTMTRLNLLTIAGLVIAFPTLLWLGEWLITLLFSAEFVAAKWSMLLLIEATIISVIIQFHINFFNAIGRKRIAVMTALPAIAISLPLLPVLSYFFGATGTSLAVLLVSLLWWYSCTTAFAKMVR